MHYETRALLIFVNNCISRERGRYWASIETLPKALRIVLVQNQSNNILLLD